MEPFVEKIISSKTRPSERLEAYQYLIRFIQEEKDIPPKLLEEFNLLLNVLKIDVNSNETQLSLESLHLLGIFLRTEVIVNVVETNILGEVIDELCSLIMTSSEKMVCTRALWCMSKFKVPLILWIEKLDKIMEIVQRPQPDDPKLMSASYELEVIRLLNRLLNEMPEQMATRVLTWSRRLCLATVHPATKVREPALAVLETVWPLLQKQQTQQSLGLLINDLKEKLVPGMTRMFKEKQEIQSLRLWRLLLKILGKALHQGASLINTLLGIVEKGFKSPIPEVKVEAFNSWYQLIVNFGSEIDVLTNPKRLRLVMQPLKANNARTELVAHSKFRVWWFLIQSLGSKLVVNLEMVLHPFLQFCFGLENNQSGNLSNNGVQTPDSQKMNIQSSQSSPAAVQKFSNIHRLGCQALALILDHKADLPISRPHFNVEDTAFTVFESSPTFLRHSVIIIACIKEAVLGLGPDKKDLHLQLYLLHLIVSHIKMNIDSENRKEFSEALILFLNLFEDFVSSGNFSAEVLLKLLEVTTCLPKKVLHSSAYSVGATSVMTGHSALYLIKLLFLPPLIEHNSTARFGTIFQKLVQDDDNIGKDTLTFTELTIKTLDSVSIKIPNSETLVRLWNVVATNLLEKIEITNDINQGDSLEHDFGCIYSVLLFPISHLYDKPLLQGTKVLDTTWTHLCKKLGKLEALVSNAPTNVWCEELSFKILNNIQLDLFHSNFMQENLSNLLITMITTVDFSNPNYINPGEQEDENAIPRKNKSPLGHLTSFIIVYTKLVTAVTVSINSLSNMNAPDSRAISNALCNLSNVAKILFIRLTFSEFIKPLISGLNLAISKLFTVATKLASSNAPHEKIMTTMIELWSAFANALRYNYTGLYNTECLVLVSCILEASLLYPSKIIHNKISAFWRERFEPTAASLIIPSSFKNVFQALGLTLVPGCGEKVAAALSELISRENGETTGTTNASQIELKPVLKENEPEKESVFSVTAAKKHAIDETDNSEIGHDAKRRRLEVEDVNKLIPSEQVAIPVAAETSISSEISPNTSQFVEAKSHMTEDATDMNVSDMNVTEAFFTPKSTRTQYNDTMESNDDIASPLPLDTTTEMPNVSTEITVGMETVEESVIQTSIELDKKLSSDPVLELKRLSPKEIRSHIRSSIEETTEHATSNGDDQAMKIEISQIVSLHDDDDDNVIPSSQSTETFAEPSKKLENGSKMNLEKSSVKGLVKYNPKKNIKFQDLPETPNTEDTSESQSDSNSDMEKIHSTPIDTTKTRKKAAFSFRVEHQPDVTPNSSTKEELGIKKRSKTARKSFVSSPFIKSGGLDVILNRTKRKKLEITPIPISRHLRRHSVDSPSLDDSEKVLSTLEETSIAESSIEESISGTSNIKIGNVVSCSTFQSESNTEMESSIEVEKELTITTVQSLENNSKIEDRKKNSVKNRKRRKQIITPKEIDSQTEQEMDVEETVALLHTDVEMRPALPDTATVESELTVGTEAVVTICSEEKENEVLFSEVPKDGTDPDLENLPRVVEIKVPVVVLSKAYEPSASDSLESLSMLETDKRKSVSLKQRINMMMPQYEEVGVGFSPQRNRKTYSKGGAPSDQPEQRPLSGMTSMKCSRGMKILEAATKQNLSNYEKRKYETKKSSPGTSPDKPGWQMYKSPVVSPSTGTPEKRKARSNVDSPYGSPSVGILKKPSDIRRVEVPFTSSPANKRRVSFAEPLVQPELTPQTESAKPPDKVPVAATRLREEFIKRKSERQRQPAATKLSTAKIPVKEKQVSANDIEVGTRDEVIKEALIEAKGEEIVVKESESSNVVEEIALQGITVCEETVVQPQQFEIIACESTVVEVGANTVVETISESLEPKDTESYPHEEEIVLEEVDTSQVIEEEEAEQIASVVSEVPEAEIEVLVPEAIHAVAKPDTASSHTVGQIEDGSGDARARGTKRHLDFESDIEELSKKLDTKFTDEELCKLSNSQLINLQKRMLKMAMVVSNTLQKNIGEDIGFE